ncbi:amidohydrolase family protein [Ningiella sp. W23]|uniref:amidohydrolase family protein n=1 Tax=Ningiella sp. W23 TaxID=3023715 RepID=UPI0037573C87
MTATTSSRSYAILLQNTEVIYTMTRLRFALALFTLALSISACSPSRDITIEPSKQSPAVLTNERYDVLLGGIDVGDLTLERNGNQLNIDYGFSNNGRGASTVETLTLSDTGLPIKWQINGNTVFGNEVDEYFSVTGEQANWRASAGEGNSSFDGQSMYIAQGASPYSLYIYATALLADSDNAVNALPGGQLTLSEIQAINLSNEQGPISANVYAINGIELDPSYIALDEHQNMLAFLSPRFTMMRQDLLHNGLAQDTQLRELAAKLNAQRFERIAQKVTHSFEGRVRINNVRIFDPQALALTEPKSVVIQDNKIVSVDERLQSAKADETLIDGKGGSLIPGLYEMHAHMSDNRALLNVLAGVTSVRDMGNDMDVLDALIEKIEGGTLIGPRITKSGFIEGKSPFSSATGEMAATKQEAVDLVKMYGERGDYFQIKIYSSIKGEWVPAMAREAEKYGMRVAGHIPAFSNVDEMLVAGYDEVTHINQVMLSWVLEREEDTRTLFRITGMKRFVDLDLNSEKVQNTINTMVENNIAVDPTVVIHEFGLTARNGETRIGMQDYIENMPIGVQRGAKQALLNVADEQEDEQYRLAFAKIIEALSMMHERGIFIVPGTDLGGAFELHRELELFQQLGMSNAEVLKRASYDMANYLGYGDSLGSIEEGKLADFFLVPENPLEDLRAIKRVAMVVKDGKVYYPSEVYPEFGIRPFVTL